MHVVKAEFMRFDEVALPALIDAVGVYVIWDSQAVARPSYIGEGVVLKRLSEHAGRFAKPFDGYLALLGDRTGRAAKSEAELVEALLLEVAAQTDRLPPNNVAPGKTKGLDRLFRSHGVVRVAVSGWDPLAIPWQSRRMSSRKTIRLEDLGGVIGIEHNWRLRRLQS
ncbi:MAG: hypothetical protein JNJ80_09245 [Gemmatimonadetes bacterium]|nr:hypothetical protein [Gemmatimonadota bacterium]